MFIFEKWQLKSDITLSGAPEFGGDVSLTEGGAIDIF